LVQPERRSSGSCTAVGIHEAAGKQLTVALVKVGSVHDAAGEQLIVALVEVGSVHEAAAEQLTAAFIEVGSSCPRQRRWGAVAASLTV